MTARPYGGLSTVDGATLDNYDQFGPDLIFLKVPWSSISPNSNPASGGSYDWSFIDNALAAYPNARFTLRIQAGATAPGWLKTATGTVDMYNTARKQTANCCLWWTTTAINAWGHMIAAAGARYNSNSRVVIVSSDLAMVVYSEPWILGNDDTSAINAYNLGLNLESHKNSVRLSTQATINAFPDALVELCIHDGMQYATSTGCVTSKSVGRDFAYEMALAHGKHLIMTDYGLGVPDTAAAHVTQTGDLTTKLDVYDWLKYRTTVAAGAARGPVGFQLTPNGQTTPADYIQMAQNAVDLGGSECETSGWGSMGGTEITRLDNALKANAGVGWERPLVAASSPTPIGVMTGGNDGGTTNVINQVFTLPAGAAAGQVAFVFSNGFSTSATATISSGSGGAWTVKTGPDDSVTGTNFRTYIWYKTLTAADIGANITVTWSAQLAGCGAGVVMPAVSVGPITLGKATGGTTSVTSTGVPSRTDHTILSFVSNKANSGGTPATPTITGTVVKNAASATAAGTNFRSTIVHKAPSADGTNGGEVINFSAATNGAMAYNLVVGNAIRRGKTLKVRVGGNWVTKTFVVK